MYLIYVLGGILLLSTLSRLVFGAPVNWALEMSQFVLSAYYLLGGAYAWQQGAHVRMDLAYSRFSPKSRALTDALTIVFVIFYLVVLFAGGVSSTNYAIVYKQQNYFGLGPAAVAGQGGDDGRGLPHAPAGDRELLQGHRRGPREADRMTSEFITLLMFASMMVLLPFPLPIFDLPLYLVNPFILPYLHRYPPFATISS